MGPWEDNSDAENGVPHDQGPPWENRAQYDGPEASTPGSSDMDIRSESQEAEQHQYP